ncbi:S66 peptidase family protein [Shouchella lehensis]|uniref:LD-carboxypeptidase n=1 Tax=Shouchella lehensis TaxID=300825 RepID=A0A4Y7WMX8_9BACI|nr:LD-carboxypeptidase [Shouchella lehensis]MBG9782807.1 carboxypeptidase [Shouchella lehensis]TES49852.1 LD-carboxypeptidase [Shouchella lehensis]
MSTAPPRLNQGDTVGIVTLGSPLSADTIRTRIDYLEQLGFNILLGESVFNRTGFLAGSAESRANDFMSMVLNPDVKWILPTRGGVGVAGMIPYLDFTQIRDNPKIISGYSDITILLNALYQFANLITFQGLLLIDFRDSTPAYNFDQFFSATMNGNAPYLFLNPPGIPLQGKVDGVGTGELIGGNLTSFVDSLGTPYEINTRGKVIFLEDTHEATNTIYRYLAHLEAAGKFEDCEAILMGTCTDCPISYNTSYQDLIETFIVPLGKPLVTNVQSAHNYYKGTLPIGANVRVDGTNGTITVLDNTVADR